MSSVIIKYRELKFPQKCPPKLSETCKLRTPSNIEFIKKFPSYLIIFFAATFSLMPIHLNSRAAFSTTSGRSFTVTYSLPHTHQVVIMFGKLVKRSLTITSSWQALVSQLFFSVCFQFSHLWDWGNKPRTIYSTVLDCWTLMPLL